MKFSNRLILVLLFIIYLMSCSSAKKDTVLEIAVDDEDTGMTGINVKETKRTVSATDSFNNIEKDIEDKYKSITSYKSSASIEKKLALRQKDAGLLSLLFVKQKKTDVLKYEGKIKVEVREKKFEFSVDKIKYILSNNYFREVTETGITRSRWRHLENIRRTPFLVFLLFQPRLKNWCRFIAADYIELDNIPSANETFDFKTGEETGVVKYKTGRLNLDISIDMITLQVKDIKLSGKPGDILTEKYSEIEYNNKIEIAEPVRRKIDNRLDRNWHYTFKNRVITKNKKLPSVNEVPDLELDFLNKGKKELREVCAENGKTMIIFGTTRLIKTRSLMVDISENLKEYKKYFKPVFIIFEPSTEPVNWYVKRYNIKNIDIAIDTEGYLSGLLYKLGLKEIPSVWLVDSRKKIYKKYGQKGILNDIFLQYYKDKVLKKYIEFNEYHKINNPVKEIEHTNLLFFDYNLFLGRRSIENNFVNFPLDIPVCGQSAYDYYDNGLKEYSDFYFKYILLCDKGNAWCYLVKAYRDQREKRIYQAVSNYEKCIAADRNNPWAKFNLAMMDFDGTDINEKIGYLKSPLVKYPETVWFLENLAAFYDNNRMYPNAEEIDLKTIKIYPSYYSYTRLGRRYYYINDYNKCEKYYRFALKTYIELYPFFQLQSLFKKNSEINKSISVLKEALEYYPGSGAVNNSIGYIYLTEMNDVDKAFPYFKRAVKLQPNLGLAYLNLGDCYEKKNDKVKAEENYKAAVKYLRNTQFKKMAVQKLNRLKNK